MSVLSLVIVLAQAATSPASPTLPWQLSMQQDGCTAQRQASATDPIIVAWQEKVQGEGPMLLLHGPKSILPGGLGEIAVQLDGEQPSEMHYGSFDTTEPRSRLIKIFPNPPAVARLSTARVVSVGKKGAQVVIDGADAAITMLRQCMSRRLIELGLNPELYLQRKTAKLTSRFAAAFGPKDYPEEAIPANVSGAVLVLLKTAEDGSVTECRVLESDNPLLDSGTCKAARRGRLQPPLDSAGRPIASYTVAPIRWTMP